MHLLPRLRLADLQSLAATCRWLRDLLLQQAPESAWRAAAAAGSGVRPQHPLLHSPSVRDAATQQARAQANIAACRPASWTSFVFGRKQVLSPSLRSAACVHGGQLLLRAATHPLAAPQRIDLPPGHVTQPPSFSASGDHVALVLVSPRPSGKRRTPDEVAVQLVLVELSSARTTVVELGLMYWILFKRSSHRRRCATVEPCWAPSADILCLWTWPHGTWRWLDEDSCLHVYAASGEQLACFDGVCGKLGDPLWRPDSGSILCTTDLQAASVRGTVSYMLRGDQRGVQQSPDPLGYSAAWLPFEVQGCHWLASTAGGALLLQPDPSAACSSPHSTVPLQGRVWGLSVGPRFVAAMYYSNLPLSRDTGLAVLSVCVSQGGGLHLQPLHSMPLGREYQLFGQSPWGTHLLLLTVADSFSWRSVSVLDLSKGQLVTLSPQQAGAVKGLLAVRWCQQGTSIAIVSVKGGRHRIRLLRWAG